VIDFSWPRGAQQQARRTPLLLSIDGTDRQTDRRTLDRFIDPAKQAASTILKNLSPSTCLLIDGISKQGTTTTPVLWPLFHDNLVSRYHKGKTSLEFNEAEFWDAVESAGPECKQSAPRSRQITTPAPHHSIFTIQMLFLTPNQQCQSTEGKYYYLS